MSKKKPRLSAMPNPIATDRSTHGAGPAESDAAGVVEKNAPRRTVDVGAIDIKRIEVGVNGRGDEILGFTEGGDDPDRPEWNLICGPEGAIATPLAIHGSGDGGTIAIVRFEESCVIGSVRSDPGKRTEKVLRSMLGIWVGKIQAPLWAQRWRLVPAPFGVRWTRSPSDAVLVDANRVDELMALSRAIRAMVAEDAFAGVPGDPSGEEVNGKEDQPSDASGRLSDASDFSLNPREPAESDTTEK